MTEFIFMLTHNDATVDNARDVLGDILDSGLRFVGFKDVGASAEQLREITAVAHSAGMQVMLEIVATSADDEVHSLRNATSIGVDWVLGGTHPDVGVDILAGSGIKYCPFPGVVESHPSVLKGSLEQIVEHARELTATPGIQGVDLLAYRHETIDPVELTRAVVEAATGPVIVAGSIATLEQIDRLDDAGAWGFTIGGAIFEGRLPGGRSVGGQVRTVLEAVDAAPA
jgi:DhnA family fructose-bisphosphate aldolase class Ia